MPNYSYEISVLDENRNPLKGFKVKIHDWGATKEFLDKTINEKSSPNSFDFFIPPELVGQFGKLTIDGPMHQNASEIVNFTHFEAFTFGPDLSFEFILQNCGEVKPVSKTNKTATPLDATIIDWKLQQMPKVFAHEPIKLGCRKLSLNVVDESGNRLNGYRAQPRFTSRAPMVDAVDVSDTATTVFDVRQARSPVDVWVWPVATPAAIQRVRMSLFEADQALHLVVNSLTPKVPVSGSIEIPAPQDHIPYDGTKTDASFALGDITTGWRNRGVYDHFKKYLADNSAQIISDNNLPPESKLSLLAFHSDEIGFFTASSIGQFQANTWSGMVLPRESLNPELVMGRKWVNKLLVAYQP